MNYFFALFVLLASLENIEACSSGSTKKKRDEDLPIFIDDNPSGYYSKTQPPVPLCDWMHYELLMDLDPRLNPAIPENPSPSCDFPPWFYNMAYGYNTFMGGYIATEVSAVFTCDKARKLKFEGRLYDSPASTSIVEEDNIRRSVDVFNQHQLADLINKIHGNEEIKPQRLKTYIRAVNQSKSNTIKISTVEYTRYTVTNLLPRPSKGLLQEYRSLPDDLMTDLPSYYRLITRYGTAIRQVTRVGGLLQIVMEDNEADRKIEEIFNKHFETCAAQNMTYALGGESYTSMKNWVESVQENPALLGSTLLPVYDFIEGNSNSKKRDSLKTLVSFIKQGEKLARVLKVLEMFSSQHRISAFVRRELLLEIRQVCRDDDLMRVVETQILENDNFSLNKYWIECRQGRMFVEEKGEECLVTRRFALISGVCFSMDFEINSCTHVDMMLPREVKCVLFFKNVECQGPVYANVSLNENLADALINSSSFAYC